jgi:DNA-binding response OmpR family regulator
MSTVLVVDDEPKITQLVRDYLERAGFAVVSARDGREALMRARTERPDLVILDLGLPQLGGLDVTRQLRRDGDLPIIMLTARDDETDKLVGLELGADDYVTKPFSPRELAARVRTVLRRSAPETVRAEQLASGDLVIDARTREVTKAGVDLHLTVKEFDLLWFLARHSRQVFSRDQLMDRVWGYAAALDTGTVTVHVRRLREKIEDDPSHPRHLQTVWGVGYRFSP